MSKPDYKSSDQTRQLSKQNIATYQKVKAELDDGMTEPLKPTQTADVSKQANLMELEGIKTMTWHKKPIQTAYEELGYKDVYSKLDGSYFRELEANSYKEALDAHGAECYKKLGMPSNAKLLQEQRKKHGVNALTEVDNNPWYLILFRQFTNLFSILLEVGTVLCFIAYGLDTTDPSNLYLGTVLGVVVLLTCTFGFYQEFQANEAMASFKNYVPAKCRVLRDGTLKSILTEEIVVGDIVDLVYGMRVPADMRVVECSNLYVDNSCLTGESLELERLTDHVEEKALEAKNLMFYGTLIKSGTGKGLVIKVGDHTFMGLIAKVMTDTEVTMTPIAIEIEHFIHFISYVAFALGIIFFSFGVYYGYTFTKNLIFLIGIIVANVPEGLLATVTVGLTITAKQMATKNVLVKNLESVETLGSTSCICSDKTGTLTQNRMTVVGVYNYGKSYPTQNKLNTEAYNLIDKSFEQNDGFKKMITIGSLCSTANLEPIKIVDKREVPLGMEHVPVNLDWHTFKLVKTAGSATESGIMKYVWPYNEQPIGLLRDKYPIIQSERGGSTLKLEIPFDSKYKYQASVHDMGDKLLVCCKGAPDRVLNMCKSINDNGSEKAIDDGVKAEVMSANEGFANNGRRVLAFAYYEVAKDQLDSFFVEDTLENGTKKWRTKVELQDKLVLAGLFALEDPARVEVPPAVASCHSAGVRVIMVTGDFSLTAQAIAKDIGILSTDPAKQHLNKVISGDEISAKLYEYRNDPSVKPSEVEQKVIDWVEGNVEKYPLMCFARTSPEQKFIIVSACQQAGYIVAVTGDGVNDSPAMKKADIGIAMGIEGTDVAKDAADMILLDDNFASIVVGIMEGRLIFDNLKKSIAYTLSSNIPEILPFILFIVFQLPLPLSTQLILAIDLGTDMIPAISMAYELPEADLMLRKPRDAKIDRLVTTRLISYSYLQIGVVQAVAAMFTWFVVWNDYGVKSGPIFGTALLYGYTNALDKTPAQLVASGVWPATISGGVDCNAVRSAGNYADEVRGCWNSAYNSAHKDWTEKQQADSGLFMLSAYDLNTDMRAFYASLPRFPDMFNAKCVVLDSNGADDVQCFNMNTLKLAQTSYFVTIVIVQWGDLLISKTRYMSLAAQGMKNNFMNFGLVFETVLAAVFCYSPAAIVLDAKPLYWQHFGFPALPFFFYIVMYDEVRKYLVRQPFYTEGAKKGTGRSWFYQFTYY